MPLFYVVRNANDSIIKSLIGHIVNPPGGQHYALTIPPDFAGLCYAVVVEEEDLDKTNALINDSFGPNDQNLGGVFQAIPFEKTWGSRLDLDVARKSAAISARGLIRAGSSGTCWSANSERWISGFPGTGPRPSLSAGVPSR